MVRVSWSSMAVAEKISWYCAVFAAVMLVLRCCEVNEGEFGMLVRSGNDQDYGYHYKGCEEIYVVREGESLHSISEKCGDPFIVEENPHIHDPDDVFPGLVIKITPFNNS